MKKKSSAAGLSPSASEAVEISRLERELAQLRKEVQKMEEEALVLVDL